MQVVLVCLQPFCRNSVLKCMLQPIIVKKFTKNSYFGGSRSFKVIDVDKSKKPVTSACYGKQHVYAYLQPFSHYTRQYWQNNVFLGGYPSLMPSFKGNPLTQKHEILSQETRVSKAVHGEDFTIQACVCLTQYRSVTDKQTNGQTDTSTMAKTNEAFCCHA